MVLKFYDSLVEMAAYSRKRGVKRGGGCSGSKGTCAAKQPNSFTVKNPMKANVLNEPKQPRAENEYPEVPPGGFEEAAEMTPEELEIAMKKLEEEVRAEMATEPPTAVNKVSAALARPLKGQPTNAEVEAEFRKMGLAGGRRLRKKRGRKTMKGAGVGCSKPGACPVAAPTPAPLTPVTVNPLAALKGVANEIGRLKQRLNEIKSTIEKSSASPYLPVYKKSFNDTKQMLKNQYTLFEKFLTNQLNLREEGSPEYTRFETMIQKNREARDAVDREFPTQGGRRRATRKHKGTRKH